MEIQDNSVDAFIQEGLDQMQAFNKLTEESSVLLHRVFVQNEAGVELLEKLKNDLSMIPSILPHYTQFEAGMAEGAKMFIRNIILQCQSVEKEL